MMISERNLALHTPTQVGQLITLKGWVDSKRDHGQLVFIDLRDRSGLVQIVGDKSFRSLKPESVIAVTGTVQKRTPATINPQLATGTVEVKASSLKVISVSQPLPFPIDNPGHDIDEELRLKYRYLDLRRQRLQHHLRFRSDYVQASREYLFQKDFTEIETPLLTQSTPEGSRDFIVPSRIQPGKFFALPQSPQQYKQLLMTAGFERYFQIARCLRDEDPRADRGFEHTQIDLEISFTHRKEVMHTVESMILYALEKTGQLDRVLTRPFPFITYKEAMTHYGADKFDLRTSEEKKANKLAFAWVVDFPFFEPTESGDWTFTHNPFSMPHEEHLKWHLEGTHISKIVTQQYDLVCNGLEVAGGSIRAHDPEILKATYRIMGYSESATEASIGHMLKAFEYGTPPHGGCAHGFERLLMVLFGEEYLREVQAFPQTGKGNISVMSAPSAVSEEQLAELGISLKPQVFTSVYQAILDLLTIKKIPYEHFAHEAVLTSKQAADIRQGTTLHQGAKALVLRTKSAHALLVVPGDVRADLKSVRNSLHYSNTKLEAIDKLPDIVGLEAGAIPPFGSLLGLPTYVDSRLLDNQEIVFNAGRHDRSIKLKLHDFLQLEQPQIINHSDQ